MKTARSVFVFAAALAVLYAASGLSVQDAPRVAKDRSRPDGIEGDWSLAFEEGGGVAVEFLPLAASDIPGVGFNLPCPAGVWTFAKGKIKTGPALDPFSIKPQVWDYYTYGLDPEGKSGAIDLTFLGRNDENFQIKTKASYLIKGDWLFLCEASKSRPVSFVTIGDGAGETLRVFRRGIVTAQNEQLFGPEGAAHAAALPKDAPEKRKPVPGSNPLLGTWSEYIRESRGDPVLVRAEKRRDGKEVKMHDGFVKRVWKFSDGLAEKGLGDETFPNKDDRWRCKFDTKANPPTIDAILIDKNGKEYPEHQWKAIYEVIDHHLLICVNSSDPPVRPEKFTTSAKTAGTTLYILRRAK